jgi:hypothetical protein
MNKATEERAIQTIAAVASLAGLSLKKATTGDDLKEFTLTLAFTGVSAGLVQDHFDFERIDTRHTVNGRGEVTDLQIGDRAETGEEADAEIAAAAAGQGPEWDKDKTAEQLAAGSATVGSGTTGPDVTTGTVDTTPIDQTDEARPDIHLVGEAAALGKKRR